MSAITKNKKKKKLTNIGQHQESYWDFAASEAKRRVGDTPQLKGVIHEIAVRDSKNISAANIVGGKVTRLSKSTTAKSSDLLTTKNGVIVERFQVKDVTSNAAQKEIHKKVASNQYRNSKLVGSNETTALYNKTRASTQKSMTSSGFSSQTTTRAADNAGVKVRDKNLLRTNLEDIAHTAHLSGLIGSAVGGVGEAINSFQDVRNGAISIGEYAGSIAIQSAKSGVTTAAKTTAALGLKEGAKTVAKTVGSQSLKRIAGSNAATVVAFGVVDQGIDIVNFMKGDIDSSELASKTCVNVGSTGGAIGGAALGASIGSIVPIVGTAIGGVVGGIIGSIGGGAVGDFFGSLFD